MTGAHPWAMSKDAHWPIRCQPDRLLGKLRLWLDIFEASRASSSVFLGYSGLQLICQALSCQH